MTTSTAKLDHTCNYIDREGLQWEYVYTFRTWVNLTDGGNVCRGYDAADLVAERGPLRPVPRRTP